MSAPISVCFKSDNFELDRVDLYGCRPFVTVSMERTGLGGEVSQRIPIVTTAQVSLDRDTPLAVIQQLCSRSLKLGSENL